MNLKIKIDDREGVASNPERNYRDVQVTAREVDWNELAWSTLSQLIVVGNSPGSDEQIETAARSVLRRAAVMGTVYANPRFTVRAMTGAAIYEFVRKARTAQLSWWKHLRTVLGSARRVREARKEVPPVVRQLSFNGIMILQGKHIHPRCWPDAKAGRGEIESQQFRCRRPV